MKKTIILSLVALAGSALAKDFDSANSCGIYPITTSSKETMVAVPFVGESGDIRINQLVKAQGLSAGDMIYAIPDGESGNTYCAWKLNSGKTAWESTTTAEVGSGVAFKAPSSADATIARGQAFWLVRNTAASSTFYVMGVGPTNTASNTTITGGKWNLVGQSSATGGVTLANIASAVGNKGSVRLNNGNRYLLSGETWYEVTPSNTYSMVSEDTTLPVGEGFWIVSKADGDVPVAL